MNTTRFITLDEIDYLRVTYAVGRKNVGSIITEERQEMMIKMTREKMIEGTMHVAMVFDPENNPIASFKAFEVPKIQGWRWAGISNVNGHNHFNKTAPENTPGLDLMISFMESKGYYKFWALNTESNLNIRYKIISKHGSLMGRYDCYDEMIIPKGQQSGIFLFDAFRPIVPVNLVVRLYSLNQKHRAEILRNLRYPDYKGTEDLTAYCNKNIE